MVADDNQEDLAGFTTKAGLIVTSPYRVFFAIEGQYNVSHELEDYSFCATLGYQFR